MRTEEIQRTPRGRDPLEVSRAFQELTPLSWQLLDRRDRPVPLSAAGYVLRFGQAYHLRIVSPFQAEEIDQIRIVNGPSFLSIEPTQTVQDERGQIVYSIPFKVPVDPWAHVRRLGTSVAGDELEVVHYFKPGIYREAPAFLCPVVVRPRWAVVLVAVFLGLLFFVLERLVTMPFSRENPRELLTQLERRDSWVWFLAAAAVVWLVVTLVNMVLLYKRSRELRANFRELFPPV